MIKFDFDVIPNPERHRVISFIKSGFRIFAGLALIYGSFITAGLLFIIAEILGIIEELV
jgi:hypothetical protein